MRTVAKYLKMKLFFSFFIVWDIVPLTEKTKFIKIYKNKSESGLMFFMDLDPVKLYEADRIWIHHPDHNSKSAKWFCHYNLHRYMYCTSSYTYWTNFVSSLLGPRGMFFLTSLGFLQCYTVILSVLSIFTGRIIHPDGFIIYLLVWKSY